MPIVNEAISELDPLAATPADGDLFPLTDISDISDSVNGTTKKATWKELRSMGVTTITNANHSAVAANDIIFFDLSAGVARTLTLMAAAQRTRPLCVKNISVSTEVLTIDGDGAETIDGDASIELAPGDRVWLIPRGSAWETI